MNFHRPRPQTVNFGFSMPTVKSTTSQPRHRPLNPGPRALRPFVIASALAGLGGALYAPLTNVSPYMGFEMLLFAFITVILGGLGSIKGTLISALILGQVMSVGGTIWSPLAFVAPFMVMFVVILVKPTGLYGVTGKAFGFE